MSDALQIAIVDRPMGTEELMEFFGVKQRDALRRELDAMPYPIPYKVTRKGAICTTLGAVTLTLLRRGEAKTWAA